MNAAFGLFASLMIAHRVGGCASGAVSVESDKNSVDADAHFERLKPEVIARLSPFSEARTRPLHHPERRRGVERRGHRYDQALW